MNKLYYGDYLTIMNNMALGSVDLIFRPAIQQQPRLQRDLQRRDWQTSPDQIEAFCDLWSWMKSVKRLLAHAYSYARCWDRRWVAEFWKIWTNALANNFSIASLLVIHDRKALPMKSILSSTGSIYYIVTRLPATTSK